MFSFAMTTDRPPRPTFWRKTADPKLRVTSVALAARWIGQDRQDRTGTGPSVGADGFQDVHIHLSRLATKLTLNGIRIAGPGGPSWESGTNPKLLPSAELIRDPKDPSQADLFFQPTRDLTGSGSSSRPSTRTTSSTRPRSPRAGAIPSCGCRIRRCQTCPS